MQPLFIEGRVGGPGPLFAMLYAPAVPVRGLVVHAPAFAEEMNKSRRMVALQARALAAAGHAVLVPDLTGCGDSAGEWADASWDGWVDDLVRACGWLRRQHAPGLPLALWGLRAGGLLAVQAAARVGDVTRLLMWQPAPSGKALLQQFLRLATVGDMLGGQAAAGTAALRQNLQRGETVEVAGYALGPALALGLEAALLQPVPGVDHLAWLECSTREEATLSPAAVAPLAAWRDAPCAVDTRVVRGPAFWQTTEVEDAPALIQATLDAVAAWPRKAVS